jgi:hypothetical protein
VMRLGYDSSEGLAAYQRASALCELLGATPRAPILRALAISSIGHGSFRQAHRYGDQLRELAERGHDSVLTVEAYYVHGVTWFWQGDFQASRTHLEAALARYDPAQAHTHLTQYSQDPQVICLARLAYTLWCLGFTEQAARTMQEALTRGQALGHPTTLTYTYVWAAMLAQERGQPASSRLNAEAMIAIDEKDQVSYWTPFAHVLRGWARMQQGETVGGWDELQRALGALQSKQLHLFEPYFMALLADRQARAGDNDGALSRLAEALALAEAREERWCQPALLRQQGERLQAAGWLEPAAAALLHSLAMAQAQQARVNELRTALALARLWQAQGRAGEARRVLLEPCRWFGERSDLPELSAAHGLLAAL